MRRVGLVLALLAALLTIGLPAATAAKPVQHAALAATTVVINADGTFTADTTAVPDSGCVVLADAQRYTCSLRIYDTVGYGDYFMLAPPPLTSPLLTPCTLASPCTAQFWERVHNHWSAFSAMSAPFPTP